MYILKKSTRRWRHCITSHRHSPQSPNNIDVSQHFKKNSERKHAYNQHIGCLKTNDAKDSTFHWQTIIIEYLEVCNKRIVRLFVWSRDHCQSPCCSKYLNRKWVSAVKIAGIAVKTATIKELAHERLAQWWEREKECIRTVGDLHQDLTLMLVVANFANTKWRKAEKWLKPWHMGTHLRSLRKRYSMNTNMTGFRWFSKIFASLCFGPVALHWKG